MIAINTGAGSARDHGDAMPVTATAGGLPEGREDLRTPVQGAVPAYARLEPQSRVEECCFHCGETVPVPGRWRAMHRGHERAFCCAGCQGVAALIASAGLDDFYAATRSALRHPRESGDPQVRHPRESGDPNDEFTALEVAARAAGAVRRIEAPAFAGGTADAAPAFAGVTGDFAGVTGDFAGVTGDFARTTDETSLLVEGLHCGACVELIERWLARQPGVAEAGVNLMTRRMTVRWDPEAASLAGVLREVARLGYRATPYDRARREALASRESKRLLARAAVALLAMMQVMMFAVPAYITRDGVDPGYARLFAWASLVLVLPVVTWCASPLWRGAWRGLRAGSPGMDLPVVVGFGVAFGASLWATLAGEGAVYYDSVTMFVALLLSARWLEARARWKAGDAIEAIAPALPETALKLDAGEGIDGLRRDAVDLAHGVQAAGGGAGRGSVVAAASLQPGDRIRVAAGATVPADGEVVEGASTLSTAMLTGESWPRPVRRGDAVLAGSINGASPLTLRVRAAGAATSLSALARLADRAAAARPRGARAIERAARGFVAVQLGLAALVLAIGWPQGPSEAAMRAIAVLIVSCPCALSLAWPATLASAVGGLARRRVLCAGEGALERAAQLTTVVLDKTGTLTVGEVAVREVRLERASIDAPRAKAIAAALEQGISHPIARALAADPGTGDPHPPAREQHAVEGFGVEGIVAGRRYRLGRHDWALALRPAPVAASQPAPAADGTTLATPALESIATCVTLADEDGPLARFVLADALRDDARAVVARWRARGLRVALLSGDAAATVEAVARAAGIDEVEAGATPARKSAAIALRQARGERVAMVGDGLNDRVALARADVSVAFGEAAAATRWAADVVVLPHRLSAVDAVFTTACRTRAVIRENLAWAVGYNLVAVPLAASGQLTPLVAALAMSLSSLAVVGNALRLMR